MGDLSKPEQPKPKAFDLLATMAGFARKHGIALNGPILVDRFMANAEPRIKEALSDPTSIHGSRAKRMFEATALSLGRFRLLRTEDVGGVHAAETFRSPDFRVILDDGKQWLEEVKSVRSKEPFQQEIRMSTAHFASLQSYAGAARTPLTLAVF